MGGSDIILKGKNVAQEGYAFFHKHMLLIARLCLLSMYLSDFIQGFHSVITSVSTAHFPGGFMEIMKFINIAVRIVSIVPTYLILLHNDRFGRTSCIFLMATQITSFMASTNWNLTVLAIPLGHAGCMLLLLVENQVSRERRLQMLSGLPDADNKAVGSDYMILLARALVAVQYGLFTHIFITVFHDVIYYIGILPMIVSVILLVVGYKIKYVAMLSAGSIICCAMYILCSYFAHLEMLYLLQLTTTVLSISGGLAILAYMGAGRLALDHIKKAQ